MDIGWFLLIAWPIVVPYFIIGTEGRRGFRRIGVYVLACFAAAVVGAIVSLSMSAFVGIE